MHLAMNIFTLGVPSFENRELPNNERPNGNEGIFDIEGLTSYPKQKTKTYCVMGSSKQLSELKTELNS